VRCSAIRCLCWRGNSRAGHLGRPFKKECVRPHERARAGYLGYLFQKRALTMAQPFFFFTLYASVGDVKVSCVTCILPDFGSDIPSCQYRCS
jgi:hypothetical protein